MESIEVIEVAGDGEADVRGPLVAVAEDLTDVPKQGFVVGVEFVLYVLI